MPSMYSFFNKSVKFKGKIIGTQLGFKIGTIIVYWKYFILNSFIGVDIGKQSSVVSDGYLG